MMKKKTIKEESLFFWRIKESQGWEKFELGNWNKALSKIIDTKDKRG
jgi:hypothetical protein